MMAQGETIDVSDLPPRVLQQPTGPSPSGLLSLEEVERRHAVYVLEQVGGNKMRAAEILGISRGTLYSLLEKAKAS